MSCPECGIASDSTPPVPGWRRLVPVTCALSFVVISLISAALITTFHTVSLSLDTAATFPSTAGQLTAGDLRAAGDGRRLPSLVRQLLDDVPDLRLFALASECDVHVLLSEEKVVYPYRTFGWPLSWWFAVGTPRASGDERWHVSTVSIQQSRGGWQQGIYFWGIAMTATLVIAAWYSARLIPWLFARLARIASDGPWAQRARWIAFVLLAGSVLLLTATSYEVDEQVKHFRSRNPYVPLGLQVGEIEAMRQRGEDAELAKRILHHWPEAPDEARLMIALTHPSSGTYSYYGFGWPSHIFSRASWTVSSAPDAREAWSELDVSWGDITWRRGALGASVADSVLPAGVAYLAVLAWGVWMGARGVCRLIHAALVARRRAAGRCPSCGYPLAPQ